MGLTDRVRVRRRQFHLPCRHSHALRQQDHAEQPTAPGDERGHQGELAEPVDGAAPSREASSSRRFHRPRRIGG